MGKVEVAIYRCVASYIVIEVSFLKMFQNFSSTNHTNVVEVNVFIGYHSNRKCLISY